MNFFDCPEGKCSNTTCSPACSIGEECSVNFIDCDRCYEAICTPKEKPTIVVDNTNQGISSGAVIGIVCGVLGVIGICLAVFLIIRAKRRRQLERVLQGVNYSGEFAKDPLVISLFNYFIYLTFIDPKFYLFISPPKKKMKYMVSKASSTKKKSII